VTFYTRQQLPLV